MTRLSPEKWYRTQALDDGITLIDEPAIKAYYRCNMWLVRGRDRDLLIDSGMGVVALRENLPILTGRPVVAVASHTHFDHIGAHHEFADRWGHICESEHLLHPTRKGTVADPYVTDEIFEAMPPAPYESATYNVKAAPLTRYLWDGDMLDLGDRRFEILHLPGHSPGGIGLWEEASGVLIAGDTIYDGPLVDDSYHSDVEKYVASMRRLERLPVRLVHGGHFPSFSGERMRQLIRGWLSKKGA